ncbi:hypothetical protein [uncultured Jannaschia sp.]|uniref:hypothetical protein n=1 Tax=uncultured Jannaschia sp. TaxID=293347 RepID=UPI0026254971|nr:hypothetical protein [uncultured Jannaschia sp.]
MWSVHEFPLEAQLSGAILAGMLLLLVAIYFVRVALGFLAGRYSLGLGDFFGQPASLMGRGLFFLLVVSRGVV